MQQLCSPFAVKPYICIYAQSFCCQAIYIIYAASMHNPFAVKSYTLFMQHLCTVRLLSSHIYDICSSYEQSVCCQVIYMTYAAAMHSPFAVKPYMQLINEKTLYPQQHVDYSSDTMIVLAACSVILGDQITHCPIATSTRCCLIMFMYTEACQNVGTSAIHFWQTLIPICTTHDGDWPKWPALFHIIKLG